MSRTIVGWPTIPMTSATTDHHGELCGGSVSPDADMELIGEYTRSDYRRSTLCRPPPALCCRCARIVGAGVKLRRPLSPRRRHLDRAFMLCDIIARAFKALPRASALHVKPRRSGPDRKRGRADEWFIRSQRGGVQIEADKAKAILRQAKVVASDETGRWDRGDILSNWVFHCKDAVGCITPIFACARVVAETMTVIPPTSGFRIVTPRSTAWRRTSNLFGHLARDTAYALEHGSDDLPLRFKLWFGKAFDLARDIASFAARQSPAKSASLKSNSPPFLPQRQNATSHRQFAGQNRRRKISF